MPTLAEAAVLGSELAEARAASLLSNFRLTPATLMARIDPTWIPAKWLQYLSLEIARAIAEGNRGLLISAPPRHGKSMLSTVATPLWVLENFPEKNVVVATYGEELSTDFSRQIRDHIQQNQDILNVRLRGDTQRVQNFLTTKGGGLKAVGLRGTITGRGANVLVIDDYIKEAKEAMSPTYLEDLWTWYRTVARTRLEPGAVVIILATRWVAEDLHGRIMRSQKQTGRSFYKYIQLPAVYEPTLTIEGPDGRPSKIPDLEARDIIGRKYGEVLFPQRYNKESIEDIRTEVGSRWFEAMFQQNPLSDDNVVFNLGWIKKITRREFMTRLEDFGGQRHRLKWGRYWDMASTKEAGDFSAGPRCLYNQDNEHFYIESMERGQWSAGTAELRFAEAVEKDNSLTPDFKIGMEQEPGSSGKYSIRHFEKIAREKVKGKQVKEFPATQSKLLNAQPFFAAAEAGNVYVIVDDDHDLIADKDEMHTKWVRELFAELELFPEVDHDDQVDAVSGCYKLLTGKTGLKASIGRKMGRDSTGVDPNDPRTAQQTTTSRRGGITFGRSSGVARMVGGTRLARRV
jgi:predicted phage terminase large subunit-like protein